MNTTASHSPTLGSRLVRLLGMRVPDDAMQQRAQQSFAMMQTTAAAATIVQAFIVLFVEGWSTSSTRVRLFANVLIAVMMIMALLALTRTGRVRAAGRVMGFGMLAFNVVFATAFGLRLSPTPYVMTLAVIAVLVLVEHPRTLRVWAALFGLTFVYGLFVTPRLVFAQSAISLLSATVFSMSFFMLYLVEFRNAMSHAVSSVRSQATELERINVDLRRTIEERDHLSEQLANGQRLEAMGRMAGSIAHDFNNLLTVIRGYADLIADDIPLGAPRRTEVELLVQAVSRASNVTREVLDFAAPRAISLQPLDLAAFVRELTPSLQRLLQSRVALTVDTAPTPCIAAADRAQIERLLLNLATNARDVTPVGGTVRVVVASDGGRVRCQIVDGGPGVPRALRDRIFEPFFTTKGTTGGTGLGLASAYAIARQHGGRIEVDDAPSGGAMFTLNLPMHTAESPMELFPESPTRVPTHPGRPLDGMSVLLVEDDDALRRLAARLLQRSGASVEAFDNGTDAVEYMHARARDGHVVHVAVTDLRLPRGSGAEVIDATRRVSPATAIVAISGFLEDPEVADRAARQELHFLAKPFSEAQLLHAIDTARQYVEA